MRVRLRLQRFGRKSVPYYRVVVASASAKRDGKFLEIVGLYQPLVTKGKQFDLYEDRVRYWLSQGAQPSALVRDLILKTEALREPYLLRYVSKKKKPSKKSNNFQKPSV